jgi:hypothetical protein
MFTIGSSLYLRKSFKNSLGLLSYYTSIYYIHSFIDNEPPGLFPTGEGL